MSVTDLSDPKQAIGYLAALAGRDAEPGSVRLDNVRESVKTLYAKLEADARALWASKVCWAFARQHGRFAPGPDWNGKTWGVHVPVLGVDHHDSVRHEADSPDLALVVAAEAVWLDLPPEVRAGIGPKP